MSRLKQHPRPKSILAPKDKKDEDKGNLSDNSPIFIEDDEFNDSDLFHSAFLENDCHQEWLESFEPSMSSLIGSSSERATLIAEHNDAFQLLQTSDLAKVEEQNEEANRRSIETQRVNQLRFERSSQVPEDPSNKKDAVTVNVRHINMHGLQSRSFPSSGTVSFVYQDWIGSLSALPEHLCKVPGEGISPSEQMYIIYGGNRETCTSFPEW